MIWDKLLGWGSGSGSGLIGVDLSASAVKTLELSGSIEVPLIEQSVIVPLAEGAMVDNALVNFDGVAQALRAAISQHHGGAKRLAFALPDAVVMMKTVTLAPWRANANSKSSS